MLGLWENEGSIVPTHHVLTAMCSQPCAHSHALTAMCSQPCAHSHALTAMCSQPCAHSHVLTAMRSQPCAHSHGGDSQAYTEGFPGGSVVKNPPANAGDAGLISGSGRFPEGGNGTPVQYPCLENPMNRGA